jgi:hypothetical protein
MPKQNGPQTSPDEPSIEQVRIEITRKIFTLLGMHRKCREPICRRMRRCAGADLRCQRDFPAPPVSADEQARAIADFYKALQKRAAEIGAEEKDDAERRTVSAPGPHISARERASYPCKASPDRAPSRRRGART